MQRLEDGRSVTILEDTFVETWAETTSIRTPSAVKFSDSATEPTCSVKLMRVVLFTPTSSPVELNVLKPIS